MLIAAIILSALGLVSTAVHIGTQIRANRIALKQHKPRPFSPADIAQEALGAGKSAVTAVTKAKP